jgi:anaerobic magnesium-protoporphyrin IX monomethyl ester cyclase
MKRILFSHSYFLRFDPKQWRNAQPYAPLGTLYAAALMRAYGYTPFLFDAMFAQDPEDIRAAIEHHRPNYLVIYDDGFNYLTKMCLTNMREAAFRMIALARQYNCTVIVSSSDATDHYDKYLAAGADYVLLGEGEQTLLELVQHLDSGGSDPADIPGLVYRQEGSLQHTPSRPVMKDLDALPLPAWDLVDLEPYRQMWLRQHGYFSINISTTRGCPFKCNWCAKPIYGNRYNARSPRHVVQELKLLRERVSFDHIWFCDDIFGLKPGWVGQFADLVEAEDLPFRFKIQSRADLLVQEHYVRDLARAGCDNVWMGAESGSQKILDAMDKGITVEQITQATALLKKHDIKPSFFIQFGYLGETKKDIELTIGMINRLLPHDIGISVSYPLPGTVFYEKVKAEMQEKQNWTDSDDLALMFRNRYQPPFYKQLHRYVHKAYRKHLALANMLRLLKAPFSANAGVLKKAA